MRDATRAEWDEATSRVRDVCASPDGMRLLGADWYIERVLIDRDGGMRIHVQYRIPAGDRDRGGETP